MVQFGEMEWEDEDRGPSDKSKNNKDVWLRLNPGPNVIRLITKPHKYIVHKGIKKQGEKGFGQKVSCSNPDGKGKCPLCEKGYKAGERWFFGVIEGKNHTYKILDVSWQVYSQIKSLAQQTDIWGDPTKYDVNIIVKPEAGPTGYYFVQPVPHKALTPADEDTKAKAPVEDIKRKCLPPTLEQVQKRLANILGEDGELEPPPAPQAKDAAKGNAKGGKKAAAQPQATAAADADNVEDVFPSYDGNS